MMCNNPLDDIEDVDEDADKVADPNVPEILADLPDPFSVLQPYREPAPRWLGPVTRFTRATFKQFLRGRVAFYPGAGKDGQLFSLFAKSHSAHCFVHADLEHEHSIGDILAILQGEGKDRIYGYDPVFDKIIPSNWWQPFEQPPGYGEELELGTSLFSVLKKRPEVSVDHGPEYLYFLHVSIDAYWLYWNLWGRHDTAPFAMLLHDHGFGGNRPGCHFGGAENALYQMANQAGFPDWLLVAEDTDSWPGYHVASDWALAGGAMHDGTMRRLYRRTEIH
jgi:hypothetical protein